MSILAVTKNKKQGAKWSDVKKSLGAFKRPDLVAVVADLYRLSKANRDFLHARFSVGNDPLEPYKAIIRDSLYPDVMRDKPLHIVRAKRAISQYTKALGDPKSVLELMVYFVEQGNQFTVDLGDIDEPFYLAMLRMYDRAINQGFRLDEDSIREYVPRFKEVMESSSGIGRGYHDELASMYYDHLSEYDEAVD